jgi:hypothetical protein
MTNAPNWKVHYLQNGDPDLQRSRPLASMNDALMAACALRRRHVVQFVAGPNGEKFDSDAIVEWYADNVK